MMTVDKDYMGALAAGLCVLHCFAIPLLLALGFTMAGISFLENELIHKALILPVLIFAFWSFPNGFQRHRNPIPTVLGLLGVSLMLLAMVFESAEVFMTVVASLLLIVGHLYNRSLIKQQQN